MHSYNYGTLGSNSATQGSNSNTDQSGKSTQLSARQRWGNHIEFTLSCLGYAVGLGNVWRFPYLCYKNGGGAFFIPYFISLFCIGIPLFLAEISIGQFARASPLTCWGFCPLFRGVGLSMLFVSGLIGIYYIVIIAWSMYYLFASMKKELPWTWCDDSWATLRCRDGRNKYLMNISECVGTKKIMNEVCVEKDSKKIVGYFYENYTHEIPASQFLRRKALNLAFSPGIYDIGTPKLDIVLCLILTWILIALTISKGIKSSGKIIYFTALFPYFVLLILFSYGISLEGASNGLKFYLYPKLHTLANGAVWKDALVQIFFSLGVGWGCLMALSSYNDFNDHVVHDSIIISLGNCGTSIFAGFVIFSYLGHFAHVNDLSVDNVAKSGVTLAFAIYPQALAILPRFSVFFSICFFAMLFMLGFNTEFAVIDTLVNTVCEILKLPSKFRPIVLVANVLIFFLLGLSMTTDGGTYVLNLMDDYSGSWNVMIISLFVCIAITVSGAKKFTDDIECMMGPTIFGCIPWVKGRWFFIACWTVVAPLLLCFIMIFTIATYKPPQYGDLKLYWPVAVGRLLTFTVLLSGAALIGYDIYQTPGTFKERIELLTKRTDSWKPLVKSGEKRPPPPQPQVQPESATDEGTNIPNPP